MNAFECLEAYRKAAGFDGWAMAHFREPFWQPLFDNESPTGSDRPAWRDGDGWFVLPEGWTWNDRSETFNLIENGVRYCVWQGGRNGVGYTRWELWNDDRKIADFPTAPEAFRAAERYLSTSEASDE